METNETNDAVELIDNNWSRALQTGDANALNEILADDFTIVGSSGRVLDKRRYMDFIESQRGIFAPASNPKSVKIYGDTAVVRAFTQFGKDDTPLLLEQYTNVYIRNDGRWRAISSHATVADPIG